MERVFGEYAAAAAGRHRRVVGAAAAADFYTERYGADHRADQLRALHVEVAHEQAAVRAAPNTQAFVLRDARRHEVLGDGGQVLDADVALLLFRGLVPASKRPIRRRVDGVETALSDTAPRRWRVRYGAASMASLALKGRTPQNDHVGPNSPPPLIFATT